VNNLNRPFSKFYSATLKRALLCASAITLSVSASACATTDALAAPVHTAERAPAITPIIVNEPAQAYAPTYSQIDAPLAQVAPQSAPSYSVLKSADAATLSQATPPRASAPMQSFTVAAKPLPATVQSADVSVATPTVTQAAVIDAPVFETKAVKPSTMKPVTIAQAALQKSPTTDIMTDMMMSGKVENIQLAAQTVNPTLEKPILEKPSIEKTDAMMKTKSPMNRLLGKYVKAPDAMGVARFDYAGLKASQTDQAVLAEYIKTLESKNPTTMSATEATAFWANLYNAVTIKVVIDNYPVKSIKDIKSGVFSAGPWKKKLTTVNGTEMTLDEIEHETLRKKYPSPLIHYMVNCASIGCPNLKNSLWDANTMDADREAAAKIFINSSRGAKVTSKGLVVSSIYDWFQEDFGGTKTGVLAHLSKYATGDLKSAIESGATIKSFDYDWTLNE